MTIKQDLSTVGSVLVGACSMLREDPDQRASDWITVALRTITLLKAEGATLSIATPEQIEQALWASDVSLKDYAQRMAGGLVHFTSLRNKPLADEIAHTAEGAAKRHNYEGKRYANAS